MRGESFQHSAYLHDMTYAFLFALHLGGAISNICIIINIIDICIIDKKKYKKIK